MKLICRFNDRGADMRQMWGRDHEHYITIEHNTARECMDELIELKIDHDLAKYTPIEIESVQDGRHGSIFKIIELNNGGYLIFGTSNTGNCLIERHNSHDKIEEVTEISDSDLVMLYDYYRNCKAGMEKSDYIKED